MEKVNMQRTVLFWRFSLVLTLLFFSGLIAACAPEEETDCCAAPTERIEPSRLYSIHRLATTPVTRGGAPVARAAWPGLVSVLRWR